MTKATLERKHLIGGLLTGSKSLSSYPEADRQDARSVAKTLIFICGQHAAGSGQAAQILSVVGAFET